MDADGVKTPYQAVAEVMELRHRSSFLEFEYDDNYEVAVQEGLAEKLGMPEVSSSDLYAALKELVKDGIVREEFSVKRYRAGISDEIEQPRVLYWYNK